MNTFRLIACLSLLSVILGFSNPAAAANSPDGSSLTPGGSGSLVTSAGTWTFSTTTGSGGNNILLNGTWVNARAVKLIVANAGQMYSFSASSHWYQWSGSSFTSLSGTPFPISADGSTMFPGGSVDLVTSAGIWAFSTATGTGGNLILLNGASASNGSGVKIEVDNGGNMYTQNNLGNWYVWSGSSWTRTSDPNAAFSPVCASAVVVGLKWSAVSGAATYNISRNGSNIETGTALLAYTDQGVVASTSYAYVLTALNSSGATVSTQTINLSTPAATSTGDAAYCPSSLIASMTVNWSSGITQANGSDLWSQTLGSDGNEYGFFGDGGGFGGSNSPFVSWGIGEITSATPGDISTAVNVYGGLNTSHAASIGGKATGILAVGPTSSQTFYALGGTKTCPPNPPNQCRGGSNNLNIVYSPGNAWSWTDNAPNWTFCTATSAPGGFCPTSFLQNGAGYSGNTDGYVYLYGGTQNEFFESGTPGLFNAYLWRVQTSQILSNTAYQAFTGVDVHGNPTWATGSFATLTTAMKPVYTDHGPRPLPLSSVIYNAGLHRYIASTEGAINQVAFYEAPNPWGPWSAIGSGYFNSNPSDNSGGWGNFGAGIALSSWGNGSHGDGLGINFAPKWTSSDGKTMWIVFSSDGTASISATFTPLAGQDMDAFSAVPVTFTTY